MTPTPPLTLFQKFSRFGSRTLPLASLQVQYEIISIFLILWSSKKEKKRTRVNQSNAFICSKEIDSGFKPGLSSFLVLESFEFKVVSNI